ncbi:trypsin-2-like [Phlebotomus argentipes]|uniref:trypsin-2-like n=1 Tax=Phlebotomus argentipes TaxID=94469 RepID=UPI0028929A56|nr:trypsin-2-like [Phlebotomus argentipes]
MFTTKVLFCLFGIFLVVSSAPDFKVQPRISGGSPAGDAQYPFMCSIRLLNTGVLGTLIPTHICGGTLLSPSWVLTATDCVWSIPSLDLVYIVCGTNSLIDLPNLPLLSILNQNGDKQVRSISTQVPSPGGGPLSLSVLGVSQPFTLNAHIQPVNPASLLPPEGSPVTIMGWQNVLTTQLQVTNVDIISNSQCQADVAGKAPAITVTANMFCTGNPESGYGDCDADKGSPVMDNDVLIGVNLWSPTGCAVTGLTQPYPNVHFSIPSFLGFVSQFT